MDEKQIAELADLWIVNRDKHRAGEIINLPASVVFHLIQTGQVTVEEREALRPLLMRFIQANPQKANT